MKNETFIVPESIPEIEKMIRDEVQENIHLDYKDSRAIRKDAREQIAKDVSSFANSDGGVLIYGVREKDQLPIEIDDGVDDAVCSREWIETSIMTCITPRLNDVRILPLPILPGRSLYVIEIGKTFRGPHQASDKKYYKRHNFMSVPMEDYEIADVRNRRRRTPPLVVFQITEHRNFMVVFDVVNVGDATAEDVKFEFVPPISWPLGEDVPKALANGIQRLPPKQKIRFRYATYPQIFGDGSRIPTEFSVHVSYFHPDLNARLSEEFPVNFEALRGSMSIRTNEEEHLRDIVEGLKKLTSAVENAARRLEPAARDDSPIENS